MRLKIYLGVLLAAFACLSLSAADAKKAPAKFEVQLLWGTDLPKSPDPTHKPVDAEVGRKLGSLPLRFKN
ncbi:MAG TPA: hypothetical protein VHH88_00285, partial [Verrucomicrobiae bacterium]|nr:hypothetical protein [Verrucomicrobiae bacterium]